MSELTQWLFISLRVWLLDLGLSVVYVLTLPMHVCTHLTGSFVGFIGDVVPVCSQWVVGTWITVSGDISLAQITVYPVTIVSLHNMV